MILIHDFEKVSLFTKEKRITISPTEVFGKNSNQARMSELFVFLLKYPLHITGFRINNFDCKTLTYFIIQIHNNSALYLPSAKG